MPADRAPLTTELPVLTGLRGFAAFWVLLYHAWVEAVPRAMTLGRGDYAITLTPAFSGGWAGVDIFFTLSAFLLSLPFVSWQLGLAPRPALGHYWQRRILRIAPAYYTQIAVLLLLAGLLGIGAWPGAGQLLGNLLLWFNVGAHGVTPLNAVTYTLSIEFCFYLLLPVLALMLRPRWWLVLLAFAVVETQLYRHLMFDPAADIPHKVVVLEQLPGRLDQFVAGMLAAYAYGRAALAARRPAAAFADALFVAGIAGVIALLALLQINYEAYWQGHWLVYAWHGLAGGAVALMLYAAASGSRVARAMFDNRALRYLGLISFGVYLWHYPILNWLSAAHAFDRIAGYRLPWTLPVLLLLSCAVADVSYRLIERPLLRIGRRRSLHPNLATEHVPEPRTA